MTRSFGAQCGHVKRRLNSREPLEGKTLEFALSLIDGAEDDIVAGIAEKLKAGAPLSDYEHHIMVDVILLHAKLSG